MNTAVFDIETSHLHPPFGVILLACVKDLGGAEVETFRIDKRPYKGSRRSDDSKVVGALIERLSRAEIVIAHNGLFFDRKFLNARGLKIGRILNPRGKLIDPVLIFRKYFHLGRGQNTLDGIADFLECATEKTRLLPHVWVRAAIDRDREALDYIQEHCIKDVLLLEEVVQRMLAVKFEAGMLGDITQYGSDR